MIYNYPFFRFPYSRKYHTSYYNNDSSDITNYKNSTYTPYYNSLINESVVANTTHSKEYEKKASPKSFSSSFSFLNNFLHQDDRNENEWCFEFFGIKLYYDDILLITLIFFLYKEEVKDNYLFVSLILLLLS